MANQIIGFYTKRKEKILKEFDRLSLQVRDPVAGRYGEEFAGRFETVARREFEKLIPEIPYMKGLRAKPLNRFLIGTAQALAVFKAMKILGKTAAEAWEICHHGIRKKMADTPHWKFWLMRRFMFSRLFRMVLARRARKKEKGLFGDFEIEYLTGDGVDFDFGVNYLKCGNLEFAKQQGGEEFAPYICMSDIAMSEAMGWGLKRTQTLADGCSHCDFRFKKGAKTQITSRTPEVQQTIDRIREYETEHGVAG